MKTLQTIGSLLCNVVLIALVASSIVCFLSRGGEGNMAGVGPVCFRYFTIDSNVFCALCCLPLLFFGGKGLLTGDYQIPQWALLLKFVGTAAVTVTMVTVLVFLGPLQGFGPMFAGKNLYLHLICPLLALLSLCLMEGGAPITLPESLWGLLPTLVYGVVYAILVLKTKQWPDFYGFNRGGMWYVSFPAMTVGAFGLSVGIMAIHNGILF